MGVEIHPSRQRNKSLIEVEIYNSMDVPLVTIQGFQIRKLSCGTFVTP